jgi:hypothetical protein
MDLSACARVFGGDANPLFYLCKNLRSLPKGFCVNGYGHLSAHPPPPGDLPPFDIGELHDGATPAHAATARRLSK